MRSNTPDRFWSFVDRGDGCWNWRGVSFYKGYGLFSVKGRTRRAHRLAWEFTHGEISDGLVVMHTCDNRKCVNPAHLSLGTQADNIRDCVLKGRNARGERQHLSRLNETSVREIRRSELSVQQLIERYGVTETTIRAVRNRTTWAFVEELS